MSFHNQFINEAKAKHIRLRPAYFCDFNLAFLIKTNAGKNYIKSEFGWDENVQLRFHSEQFIPENTLFIIDGQQNVGWISIIEGTFEYKLDEFYILPEFQNKGMGSRLLSILVEIANEAEKPVNVRVMRVNTSGIRLYEKFGFKSQKYDRSFLYMKLFSNEIKTDS